MKLISRFTILIASLTCFTQAALGYSLGDASIKWNKPSVTVCWGDSEDLFQIKAAKKALAKDIKKFQLQIIDKEMKLAIQNKVQEQFTIERTGLEFIGWKHCSVSPQADIIVSAYETSSYEFSERDLSDLSYGKANVAMSESNFSREAVRKLRPAGEKGFVFLRKSADPNLRNPVNHLLVSALHEFGHAAGLLHEHLQVDSEKDPLCIQYYNKEMLQSQHSSQNAGQAYGVYDPESVMNYCNLFSYMEDWRRSNSIVQLSAGDRHTLSCLYKPEAEAAGSCDPQRIKFNEQK